MGEKILDFMQIYKFVYFLTNNIVPLPSNVERKYLNFNRTWFESFTVIWSTNGTLGSVTKNVFALKYTQSINFKKKLKYATIIQF